METRLRLLLVLAGLPEPVVNLVVRDDDGMVIGSGICQHPLRTLRRVHRVLLARQMPGVPLRLSEDWRPHFPGFADGA